MLFALAILLAGGLSGVHAVSLATAPGTRPLWLAVPPLVPRAPAPPPRPRPAGLISIAATGSIIGTGDRFDGVRELLRADVTTADLAPAVAAAGLRKDNTKIIGGYGEAAETQARGVRIAVLGFPAAAVADLTAAKRAVTAAARRADLVVVHARLGAPGRYRVAGGVERHRGEDRGDPVRFAHAVVDAGADLVLGHGPGVLRGMEFHRGRLIAYSLGTFAGPAGRAGRYAAAGVLRVMLRADGRWAGGTFTATRPDRGGRPVPDRTGAGLRHVRELSAADFPGTGPAISENGGLTAG
ncbi:poly-gamma-glutamate capsule biosynthesis protein CapA/YwtB (metallophosphatase superfamily) [Catenuloplanes nepalensis]|uniref:Poly-gamma-glutamate capsule biosynthesis protein CapA/YwtB (Metallophosphatase superfamily) n=1 Tax=Catenuloplanes nepalensis TaxID=587533 RepID=A0ABT9N3K2_9ACTN|nr:CapA family protein [Catenuloplanes nepalensis]MDP9798262.1 poly-gamma-glutamate capsule biosynthesis protein CapA/YwtB (metallophosphatase superfamily) [Catenuloplanes nepalensis]